MNLFFSFADNVGDRSDYAQGIKNEPNEDAMPSLLSDEFHHHNLALAAAAAVAAQQRHLQQQQKQSHQKNSVDHHHLEFKGIIDFLILPRSLLLRIGRNLLMETIFT